MTSTETTGSALWAPRTSSGAAAPAGAGQRFPLSLQQEFLELVDTGDAVGPFSPHYTIVGGWRLTGPLDVDLLRAALDDVVVRHEALRTRIFRRDPAHQRVFPPAPVDLAVRRLAAGDHQSRKVQAEQLVDEVEAGTFDMDQVPQLRAVLGRFDDREAVLVLMAHHTGVDGWSMQLIARDLASCYAARRTGRPVKLPEPGQYRQYVAWQQEHANGPAANAARQYWRRALSGAQVTPITADRPRSAGIPPATAYYRFLFPDHLRVDTLALSSRTRSSPFMVLTAAYALLLHLRTGATDVVTPTFTPGRRQAFVLDMVGSFYDLVPLRIDLARCRTFRDLVGEVRRACLAAYQHEVPFLEIMSEAPELMQPATGDLATCCLFQVVQSPHIMTDQPVGDLRYTAIRRRLRSQPLGSAVPDGALWSMELNPPGIVGSIGFTTNLLTNDSMVELVADFRQLLTGLLSNPDRQI